MSGRSERQSNALVHLVPVLLGFTSTLLPWVDYEDDDRAVESYDWWSIIVVVSDDVSSFVWLFFLTGLLGLVVMVIAVFRAFSPPESLGRGTSGAVAGVLLSLALLAMPLLLVFLAGRGLTYEDLEVQFGAPCLGAVAAAWFAVSCWSSDDGRS